MGTINFSGLATGIDFEKLISATSDVARAVRQVPDQKKVQELTDTNSSLSELKSKLATLKSKIQVFASTNGGGTVKSASSSDETVITASAAASAPNGTYSITPTQLAKSHTLSFNDRFAASDSILASGIADPPSDAAGHSREMAITVGTGDTFYVDISPTTTLSGFADSINSANQGVIATVVNTGQSPNPYALVLKSTATGATDGTITISTGADINAVPLFQNKTEDPAQNATFSITGISGSITASSNSVSGVIPGVTFNLVTTSSSAVTITVADDSAGTIAKVNEFVTAFNDIVTYLKEKNKIERQENGDKVSNVFSPLASTRIDENAIQSIRNQIVSAAYEDGTKVKIFSDLGIKTQQDGTLKFVTAATADVVGNMTDALAQESSSVAHILQTFADAVSLTKGTIDQYTGFNQIIDNAVNANKTQITNLNQRIADAEANILRNEQNMRQRFARLEALTSQLQSQQAQLSSALAGLQK